jgi:hypothetical protein
MLRQAIALFVAALVASAPVVHEICLIACREAPATTSTPMHHQHGGAAPVSEHAKADNRMETSDAGMPREHHPGHVPVKQATHEAECCASGVSATPACCVNADDIAPPSLAAVKVLVDPPAVVSRIDVLVTAAGSDSQTTFFESIVRPPVPLSTRTPLRV